MSRDALACLRGLSEERLALASALLWLLSNVLSRLVDVWLAVGGVAIALGLLILATGGVERRSLRVTPLLVGLGLAAGGLMTLTTYLLYPLAGHLVPDVVTQAAALYTTFGGGESWKAVLMLPMVVVGEELVWRGVVQGAIARQCGAAAGVALSTVAYCVAVIPVGSALLVLIALGCGLYWSLLRAWSRSLVPVLASHLIWSLFVFILAPLATR